VPVALSVSAFALPALPEGNDGDRGQWPKQGGVVGAVASEI